MSMTDEHKRKIGLGNTGKVRSEETKNKIRLSLTGRKRPDISAKLKGRKQTTEHNRKISEYNIRVGKRPPQATKEQHQSIEWRTNISNALKGRKCKSHTEEWKKWASERRATLETRLKMRDAQLKRVAEGRHNNYKGGIEAENEKVRRSIEMKWWRKGCMERDNYTDAKTGQRGGDLIVHHVNNFSSCRELRTSIENGITLSKESHKLFHKIYGFRNNTREQLLEFLNSK
jgi:hypothetical protein